MYQTSIFKSVSIWKWPRFLGLLVLALIALPGAINLAQQSEEPEEMPAVSILEFHTYDSKWIRYKNLDENGEYKFEFEAVTEFPFRHVASEIPIDLVTLKELEDIATIDRLLNMLSPGQALIAKLFDEHETIAELIEDMTEELVDAHGEIAENELVAALVAELVDRLIVKLIDEHELAYDEELIAGRCDTEKLRGKSPDLLCVPGANAMPQGYIFLTLYLPESFEIVAMTASIDNIAGAAAKADSSRPAAQPAPESAGAGCGPYVPGQWILASEYDASGLSLTVRPAGDCPVASYNCYQPDEGAPYLQANCAGSGDDSDSDGSDGGQSDGGGFRGFGSVEEYEQYCRDNPGVDDC